MPLASLLWPPWFPLSYFVFKRTKVLDELCLGLMTGIMTTVLAQAAYLVTWRRMRRVRTCEAIRKCKISLSVSVRLRLTQCPRLSVLLAPVTSTALASLPQVGTRLSLQRSYFTPGGLLAAIRYKDSQQQVLKWCLHVNSGLSSPSPTLTCVLLPLLHPPLSPPAG